STATRPRARMTSNLMALPLMSVSCRGDLVSTPSIGCFIVTACSLFPCKLPRPLQDRIAGKERCLLLWEPLSLDSAGFINQEERSPRHQTTWVDAIILQHAVVSNDPQVRIVTEQRIGQLQRIGKRLLRKDVVGAERENLHVQFLKLVVVDLPGRHVGR